MHSISQRHRNLLLLLSAQIVCLALGLWGYGHFVGWSVQWETHEAAWRQLAAQSDNPRGGAHVTIVDENWRVLSSAGSGGADAANRPGSGASLAFMPVDEPSADVTAYRGFVEWDGAQQVALVERLSAGYRVLHMSAASIMLPATALTDGMPLAGTITVVWVSALLGLIAYLIITRLHEDHARGRARWESQSLGQIQALQQTRDGIVFGLAKLAEFRDQETGYHLERISSFATRLAMAAGRRSKHRDQINTEFIKMIGISAALHDIGKVGVPDAILLKPGPLTPDERAIMQRHTLIGSQCITEIERRLGNSNFLRMAGEIALSHHERWNGAGYPHMLAGEEIPLSARIVAMVDVYDALSSRRVYKAPLPHEECIEVIRSEAGRHFDPDLVEVFLQIESEIQVIARKYSVEPAPVPPPPQPLPRWALAREYEELIAAGGVPDDGSWLVPSGTSAN